MAYGADNYIQSFTVIKKCNVNTNHCDD